MIKVWIGIVLCIASFSFDALAAKEEIKPLVLFQGEVAEGSFLHMVEKGVLAFEQATSITVVQKRLPRGDERYLKELENSAKQGFSPIIVQDSNSLARFANIAQAYPATKFISLDVAYDVPNILALTFNHAEGAYVVGFMAGLKTKTNKVGFIGGLDIPVINNFRCGYELGLQQANANATLVTRYINKGTFSWDDLDSAQQLSQQMLSDNVDVIFPVSGMASQAVMDTMKAAGPQHYSFGIDANSNADYPQTLLASFEKRSDKAVFAALMLLKNGIWNGTEKHFGIKQGIIQITVNPENTALNASDKQKVDELITQLKGKNNRISREILTHCKV